MLFATEGGSFPSDDLLAPLAIGLFWGLTQFFLFILDPELGKERPYKFALSICLLWLDSSLFCCQRVGPVRFIGGSLIFTGQRSTVGGNYVESLSGWHISCLPKKAILAAVLSWFRSVPSGCACFGRTPYRGPRSQRGHLSVSSSKTDFHPPESASDWARVIQEGYLLHYS